MDCHLDAHDARVFPQDHRGDALRHCLDEVCRFPLDDAADLREDIRVVDRLREVVLLASRPEVKMQHGIHKEGLPLLAFFRQAAVVAVKFHVI